VRALLSRTLRVHGLHMSRRSIRTTYEELRWVNRLDSGVILSHHLTKSQAVVEGRRLAMQRRAMHVVYRRDGLVESLSDYR
jgi:hypothetical protein